MDARYKKIIAEIQEASKTITKYFGRVLDLQQKSTVADFRTKADIETEEKVIASIEAIFPDYNIFGEETGKKDKRSEYTFVIDPLDGTNNFSLGLPIFTTSVGLIKNKKTVFGVISMPFSDDVFYAERGGGSYMNNDPIQVNSENKITSASVSYTCGYEKELENYLKYINGLHKIPVKRVLETWAPAYDYCLLASGKIEAIVNDENDEYDFLAGKLIAEEAGAKVNLFDGSEVEEDDHNQFLITNGQSDIHDNLLKILEG